MIEDDPTADPALSIAPLSQDRAFAGLSRNTLTSSRRHGHVLSVISVLGVLGYLFSFQAAVGDDTAVEEPISPVPVDQQLDQGKVQLGKMLFSDSRLSAGHGVSCASCHLVQYGLTDGSPISRGLPGAPGVTNTLTLYNVGLNARIGWSGQVGTLEDQANGVVERKSTMGAKWEDVVAILKDDSGLASTFDAQYKDGITKQNIINSLVEYEKSLTTPDAPFDQYLRGKTDAITDQAKAGYKLFKDYGCVSCHQGVNVGGNMLQMFGIFGSPAAASLGAKTPGSAKDTGIDENRPIFRVPSLRNVAETGPYFHDGSVPTLAAAINIMATYQLGRSISDDEVGKLEAFLRSLTGKYQGVSVDQ